MADTYPPDFSTSVGKVRALLPDVEQVDWENDGNAAYIFTDNHLEGLISLQGGEENYDIYRAAADAVDAVAVSEALISKVIKTEDLQTDGAKLANALIVRAQQLRRRADKMEQDADLETAFTVVDFQPSRQPTGIWPVATRTSWIDQVWGNA